MNYRSYADLSRTIVQNIGLLPRDIDLVVAVPRSGYLAAGIIALTLNRPLIDLGGFIEGKAPKVSSIFVAAGVVFEQIAHDLHAGLVQHGPRFGSDRRRGRERRVGGQQFVRRCRGHG